MLGVCFCFVSLLTVGLCQCVFQTSDIETRNASGSVVDDYQPSPRQGGIASNRKPAHSLSAIEQQKYDDAALQEAMSDFL